MNRSARNWYNCGTEGLYREGEEVIARCSDWSYWYACNKIKGRFTAGEEIISSSPYYSFFYALYAIKGRFELGEKIIKKSSRWEEYIVFLKSKGIEK